jgi:arylsulfatase A-like enzyme
LATATATATATAPTADDRAPLLLALSLSSNDYIGHAFGPDSWEAWDQLRRLDRRLAELLETLDGRFGTGGYALMLTGDHGMNGLPEHPHRPCGPDDHWQRGCAPGRRLSPSDMSIALETALRQVLPGGPHAHWIAGIAEPSVFLTERARGLTPTNRARLVETASAVLRDRFGIDDVVDIRSSVGPCPPDDDESRAALVCRSLRADGPADLYLVVPPGTFFDPAFATGQGVNHGSPYLYDRAVPLLVRAPGRVPAGVVRDRPLLFTAFARTAAALLDVDPPGAARGGEDLTR